MCERGKLCDSHRFFAPIRALFRSLCCFRHLRHSPFDIRHFLNIRGIRRFNSKQVEAIETRLLPSSLAAARRGFTFYLADPSARLTSIAQAVRVNRRYQSRST
jgi:hypothetical protein